jgi:hypothetical protein
VIDEVKILKRQLKSKEEVKQAGKQTGLAFLPNGSFVSYEQDKSITMFEEKRMASGGCACCNLF